MIDTSRTPLFGAEFTRNEPTFTHLNASDQRGHLKTAEALRLSELEEDRAEILSLPNHTEGLDIEGLANYCEQTGIPSKPLLFLDPENYHKATVIQQRRYPHKNSVDSLGKYLPDLDIALVLRDPDLEATNSPLISTAYAVHELAHASNIHNHSVLEHAIVREGILRKKVLEVVPSAVIRAGFMTRNPQSDTSQGGFIEEGYAELEKGRYLLACGYPDGLAYNRADLEDTMLTSLLLPRYFCGRKDENGSIKIRASLECATPATALEYLIEKDELLLPAMRRARHSDDGMQEMITRIEAIQPGLYEQLYKLDVNSIEKSVAMLFKTIEIVAPEKASKIRDFYKK